MTTAQGAIGAGAQSVRRQTREQNNIAKYKSSFILIVLLSVILLAMVSMAAFSANLQAKNNDLKQANSNLQAEIDSLNTQIGDATNIERIEKVATKEYGMVQPDADNYIAVSEEVAVDQDLAATIKDEAYN